MIALHNFGGILCQIKGKTCNIAKSSHSRKFFLAACGPRTIGGCSVDLLNVSAIGAEGQVLVQFFLIYKCLIFLVAPYTIEVCLYATCFNTSGPKSSTISTVCCIFLAWILYVCEPYFHAGIYTL
jgi:hypothetical protein